MNNFFKVNASEKTKNQELLSSHFRGRELKGKEYKLKDGVLGFNMIQGEVVEGSSETVWEAAGVFDNMKVWDHDVEPNLSFMDECMDWLDVASCVS